MTSLSQLKMRFALIAGTTWGAKLACPPKLAMPNDVTVAVNNFDICAPLGGLLGERSRFSPQKLAMANDVTVAVHFC